MEANGRAFNHQEQTTEHSELIQTSKPLTEHQQDAFAQIQNWFPGVSFKCFTRAVPNSVGHDYLVAIAELDGPSATQGGSSLASQSIWIMATLPEISDKIFISAYQEHPKPFFDFMASLDAKSETADQMVEGYRAKIHHTILENRNQKSFILAEFSSIWPKLILNPKKVSQNATLLHSEDDGFTGLVVAFSQQPFSKLDPSGKQQYELHAIARKASHLADIALPAANMSYLEEEIKEEKPLSPHIAAMTMGHSIKSEYTPPPKAPHYVNQPESHSLSPKDQKLLRQIRRKARITKLLIGLTLTAGAAAAYSYYYYFM